MQALYKRELYGETMALEIEVMGSTAISVANRWAMGWPTKVMDLLVAQQYLTALKAQTEQEKDILSEAVDLKHLAPREILQMHEVPEHPPEPHGTSN
jgi:hypothetical protein